MFLSLAAVPLAATVDRDDADLHAIAAQLRAGEYVWSGSARLDQATAIEISIALQRIYIYRDDELLGVATVSTGRPGNSTPKGAFTILQKARWHRSNIYSNAPMPFMQRLTWTGIALHAGYNPGRPASHGCIRLPVAFARDLFGMTTLGLPVTVAAWPVRPPVVLPFEGFENTVLDVPRLPYVFASF